MSNWAVVIGLSNYSMPGANLPSSVSDAVKMAEWLAGPGQVPAQQILCGLSPLIIPVTMPTAIRNCFQTQIGSKDDIVDLFQRAVRKSGGEGDRLFIYFSGHGLSYPVALERSADAIVAPDCDQAHPDRSLSVLSILEFFQETRFKDQFFFFDACRNLPWKGRFLAGTVSVQPNCPPPVAECQRFVCLATSPGKPAVQFPESSALSRALFAGLDGEVAAKELDLAQNRFVVRWSQLFRYVHNEVQKTPIAMPDGSEMLQVPREENSMRGGFGREVDPILWQQGVGGQTFKDVAVQLRIDPPEALSNCHVDIESMLSGASYNQLPPCRLPHQVHLPPGLYRFGARSMGMSLSAGSKRLFSLMKDAEVSLSLAPLPGGGITQIAHAPIATVAPPEVDIQLLDEFISWQIFDSAGGVVHEGIGKRIVPLQPGAYGLKLILPDTSAAVTPFEIREFGRTEVSPAIAPVPESLIARASMAGMEASARGILASEVLGYVQAPTLATFMALAAAASFGSSAMQNFGRKLQKLGFASNMAAMRSGGLCVLVGVERDTETGASTPYEQLQALMLTVKMTSSNDDHGSARALNSSDQHSDIAVGEYWFPGVNGRSELQLNVPNRPNTTIHLYVPKDEILTLILHKTVRRDVVIEQFSVPKNGPTPDSLKLARLLDLAQRSMLNGSFELPRDPADFLALDRENYVARVLAAYLFLRKGDLQLAYELTSGLIAQYPDCVDSHLVRAECLARQGADARNDYINALALGVPTFAGGLAKLWQYASRHEIGDRRQIRDLIDRRVPGVLWTTTERALG